MAENDDDPISLISDRNVYRENIVAINNTRTLIVAGVLLLLVVTVIGAGLGAFFGNASRWNQLSPLVGTVLAIEAAALGSAIGFYMAKQD